MELQKVKRTTLTMKEAAEYLGISYWLINQFDVRIDIWTHFMRGCIIDYVH